MPTGEEEGNISFYVALQSVLCI